MIDQPETELLCDLPLQRFQLGVDEFDDLAGLHVDQVIVMGLAGCFVTRTARMALV